ncbi:hypothetical protein [Erwinia sp. JH02]|nr:hypothetical protein [Erwinia sp. JH02]
MRRGRARPTRRGTVTISIISNAQGSGTPDPTWHGDDIDYQ